MAVRTRGMEVRKEIPEHEIELSESRKGKII